MNQLTQNYYDTIGPSDPTAKPAHIDLTASGRGKQLFPEFTFDRSGTNLFDLKRDRPAVPGGALAHGTHLQGQRLLVVRGHPRIEPNPKHFRRRLWLAENLFDLAVPEARLAAISDISMRRALS